MKKENINNKFNCLTNKFRAKEISLLNHLMISKLKLYRQLIILIASKIRIKKSYNNIRTFSK